MGRLPRGCRAGDSEWGPQQPGESRSKPQGEVTGDNLQSEETEARGGVGGPTLWDGATTYDRRQRRPEAPGLGFNSRRELPCFS